MCLSRPTFYPSVADLLTEDDRSIRGHRTVVNYTSFKMGYSILSLEASGNGTRSRYSSPAAIVATLEESIMDHILRKREIPFRPDAEPYTKRKLLSDLLCGDLGKDARRMRPEPIYIDWANECMFSTTGIPQPRLDVYAQVARRPVADETAGMATQETLKLASISENIYSAQRVQPLHRTPDTLR